ncbi:MAG: hypothetical protein K2P59_04820 [Acetatifactor sp.]|nr:hypothetical protein [Acetatifactor sp.]
MAKTPVTLSFVSAVQRKAETCKGGVFPQKVSDSIVMHIEISARQRRT